MGRLVSHLRTLAIGIVVFAGLAVPAVAQQRLDGTYQGLDQAHGLTLQLSGVNGRVSAPDGSGQAIQGRMQNGSVVADLIFRGKRGTARMTPKGIGLGFIWTPQDGTGDIVFAFKRQGLELPTPPAGFMPQPAPGTRNVDPSRFLASYEFWEPDAVSAVYDSVGEQYRALIRLFPAVQTDLIWKLCQSRTTARELGEALRGEGVTCGQIDKTLKDAQQSDAFNRFKRRVHAERADAMLAVECARGIHQARICIDAAQRTQRAAMSLETVKTVLRGI